MKREITPWPAIFHRLPEGLQTLLRLSPQQQTYTSQVITSCGTGLSYFGQSGSDWIGTK